MVLTIFSLLAYSQNLHREMKIRHSIACFKLNFLADTFLENILIELVLEVKMRVYANHCRRHFFTINPIRKKEINLNYLSNNK